MRLRGRVGAALALLLLAGAVAGAEAPSERVLVVALDAVPWDVVDELVGTPPEGRRPLFSRIGTPVPMVSSFPSTTTVAFAGMLDDLGAPRPPGYEARFYDRDSDRIRGGGLFSYGRIEFSWREFFDWKIEGLLRKGLGYARPLRFAHTEIEALAEAFATSDDPVLFAYVSASDAIGHLASPAALADMLYELDDELGRLREELPPFRVVVLSDHGMGGGEPLDNVRRQLMRTARSGGFVPTKRLRSTDSIVFVPFGLLSSVVAFTADERRLDAARVLSTVPGVALCATTETADRWRVIGDGQEARIVRRSAATGSWWGYRPIDGGDPLDYADLAARLDRRSGPASSFHSAPSDVGWHRGEAWLESTVDHRYPDALRRIALAFELIESPASVICSVAPGHMYGPWLTEWSGRLTVGRLRYTHGALEREDTLGFLVTDHPAWEKSGPLPFDRVFERFVELQGGSVRSAGAKEP